MVADSKFLGSLSSHRGALSSVWAPGRAGNLGCQRGWCNINYHSLSSTKASAQCISIIMGGETEAYQGQSGLEG